MTTPFTDPFKDSQQPFKSGKVGGFSGSINNFIDEVRPYLNKPKPGSAPRVTYPQLGVWPVYSVHVDSSPPSVSSIVALCSPKKLTSLNVEATPANAVSVDVVSSPSKVSITVNAEPVKVVSVDVIATPVVITSVGVEATPAVPTTLDVNAEPTNVTNVNASLDPHAVGSLDVEATPAVPTSVKSQYFDHYDPILGYWRYSNDSVRGYVVVIDPIAFADAALPLNYPLGYELEILKVQGYERSKPHGSDDLIKTDDGLIGGKEGYQLFPLVDQLTTWTYVEFESDPSSQDYAIYRGQARPPFEVASVTVNTSPLTPTIIVEADPAIPTSVSVGEIPGIPGSVSVASSPAKPAISVEADPAKTGSVSVEATPAKVTSVISDLTTQVPNKPGSVSAVLLGSADQPSSVLVSANPATPSSVTAGNLSVAPGKPGSVSVDELTAPGKIASVFAGSSPRPVISTSANTKPQTPSQVVSGIVPQTPASVDSVTGPAKPASVSTELAPVKPFIVFTKKLIGTEVSSISVEASPANISSVSVGVIPESASSIDVEATPVKPTSILSGAFANSVLIISASSEPKEPQGIFAKELTPPSKVTLVSAINLSTSGSSKPTTPLTVSVVDLDKVAPDAPAQISVDTEPKKPTSVVAVDPSQIAPDAPGSVTVDVVPSSVSSVAAGVLPEKPNSVIASSVLSPTSVTVNAEPVKPSITVDATPAIPTSIAPLELTPRPVALVDAQAIPAQPTCVTVLHANTGAITQYSYDLNTLNTKPLAWYDADDSSTITEVSGSVVSWVDKSGNNNNLTQVDSNRNPVLATDKNGKNVVDFTVAAGDVLDTTLSLNNSNITIHMVVKSDQYGAPLIYSDSDYFSNATLNEGELEKYVDGDFHIVSNGVKKDRSYGPNRGKVIEMAENTLQPQDYWYSTKLSEIVNFWVDSTLGRTLTQTGNSRFCSDDIDPADFNNFRIVTVELDRAKETLTYKHNGRVIISENSDPREINNVKNLTVGYQSQIAELIITPVVNSDTSDIVESYLSEKWTTPLDRNHTYHCSPVPSSNAGPAATSGSYDGTEACCVDREDIWQRSSVISFSESSLPAFQKGPFAGPNSTRGSMWTTGYGGHRVLSSAFQMVNPYSLTWCEYLGDWCWPIFVASDCDGVPKRTTPNLGAGTYHQTFLAPMWRSNTISVGDLDCDGDGYFDTASYTAAIGYGYGIVEALYPGIQNISHQNATGYDPVTDRTDQEEIDILNILGCGNSTNLAGSLKIMFSFTSSWGGCPPADADEELVALQAALPSFAEQMTARNLMPPITIHSPLANGNAAYTQPAIGLRSNTQTPEPIMCFGVEVLPPPPATFSPLTEFTNPSTDAIWFDPTDSSKRLLLPGAGSGYAIENAFTPSTYRHIELPSIANATPGINGLDTTSYGYNEESALNVSITFDDTYSQANSPHSWYKPFQPRNIFIVAKPDQAYASQAPWTMPLLGVNPFYNNYQNGDYQLEYKITSTGISLEFSLWGDGSQTPVRVSTPTDYNAHVIRIFCEVGQMGIQIDGGTAVTATAPSVLIPSTGYVNSQVNIAGTIQSNHWFTGEVGDILVCRAVNSGVETQLNDFFTDKWI